MQPVCKSIIADCNQLGKRGMLSTMKQERNDEARRSHLDCVEQERQQDNDDEELQMRVKAKLSRVCVCVWLCASA